MNDDTIYRQAAIDAVDIGNLHRGIVDALQNILSELPSAQPEIIRCKDCRWWLPPHGCNDTAGLIYTTENAFCNFAERRTDE